MANVAENRRARFDYSILKTFEAGIELTGSEVKSVKNGRCNLAGSYGVIQKNQVWLLNADIPAYQPKNAPPDYNSKRSRRLLLHKNEISQLIGKLHEKSLTLVPLRMYLKRGFIKVELGVGKSRKKRDKREFLKQRAAEREMKRFK